MIRAGAALLTLSLAAAPCSPAFGQVSAFAANEVRAASLKDRLRVVTGTLEEGTEGVRRHSRAVTDALEDADDWAPAVEAYYARRRELVARAAALGSRLDDAIARDSSDEDMTKTLDELLKKGDVLRSDYEFYMALPRLAAGPRRKAAQAAMRLLGHTGDYPVSLAFFLDKTAHRPPFAPLPPGVMAIRHR
jgi:hypothetical protein